VKYLDGVDFLVERLKLLCDTLNIQCQNFLEAREDGYYAAHVYITQNYEIPRVDWDTEKVNISFEIQVTTQLQETIRSLLHAYYEEARNKPKSREKKWQWNYKSNEFSVNYLGHILHYIEGTIVRIRDEQEGGSHE
jgi:hypothetical protein